MTESTHLIQVSAALHDRATPLVLEPTPLSPDIVNEPTIWLPAQGGDTGGLVTETVGPTELIKYLVTERRWRVGSDGARESVHLRLRAVRNDWPNRILDRLSDLPGDGTMWVASIAASLTTVGIAALAIYLAQNTFVALGFMANHADAAAGWSIAIYLFWIAMRQTHRVLGIFFGFLWATAGFATWIVVGLIWPEGVSDAAAANGYEALGRQIHENWSDLLVAVAPWLPTVVILVKALGLDTASKLIDKNLTAKGK